MIEMENLEGVVVPATLSDLIQVNQNGYQIKIGYFLELKHGLMGTFPAEIKKNKRSVVTIDPELLKKVANTLPPRPAKVTKSRFHVNEEIGIAYQIRDEYIPSQPIRILTHKEFDQLTTEDPHPFQWAAGLIGPGMTQEEFARTIAGAIGNRP